MTIYETFQLGVPGALRIESSVFSDTRGSFVSILRDNSPIPVTKKYSHVYISYNINRHTLRGFHYQEAPKGENKIVTCLKGSALHVLVSKCNNGTLCVCENLLDKPNISTFVPFNAASAFLTLEEDTIIQYLSDMPYDSKLSKGFLWNDPSIGYEWGVTGDQITISQRDLGFPLI